MYKTDCIFQGKLLSLTFDKKDWGTWNIGTFSYNNTGLAGFGTVWEYVYRVSETKLATEGEYKFSGGNHGNEALLEIKFYDGTTGAEVNPAVGSSVTVNNLKIVEKTQIAYAKIKTDDPTIPFCNVIRTYYVAGNKIELLVNYEMIKDSYFALSYSCMFPINKKYGQNIRFYNIDGTTKDIATTKVGTTGGQYLGQTSAAKCTTWGYEHPEYTFDIQVYNQKDSCNNFNNSNKTFYWDMNDNSDKLYFSKFNTGDKVTAGTKWYTRSTWTFSIDSSKLSQS
jgi:hypothetical protein